MGKMLEMLAQDRDNLLLGEVAALLHNLGKLSDRFIAYQLKESGFLHYEPFGIVSPLEFSSALQSKLSTIQFDEDRKAKTRIPKDSWVWDDLNPVTQRKPLREKSVNLLKEPYYFHEILGLWHLYGSGAFQDAMPSDLLGKGRHGHALWLLDVCHGIMQIEKGDGTKEKQQNDVYISTAFGFENLPISRLGDDSLSSQQESLDLTAFDRKILQQRVKFLNDIQTRFSFAIADTQRPINEITLRDWSRSVATLFKTLLAQEALQVNILQFWLDNIAKNDRSCFHWRTLRVTVDVLGVLGKAYHLSDLVGRDDTLAARFDAVKHLIEEDYPLGNEIYRDSTGIYFTFPGLDNAAKDELLADLEPLIHTCMTANGSLPELMPIIAISDPWHEDTSRGWTPDMARQLLAMPHIDASHAIESGVIAPNIDWQSLWPVSSTNEVPTSEICPVCQLRPVSSTVRDIPYRIRRCVTCETMRKGSITRWKDGEVPTIWLDEIADEHDRVALIVGRFQLDQWLDGTMINTLLGSTPARGAEKKQPSPARIMRIWRTTQEFWEKSVSNVIANHVSSRPRLRLQISWNGNQKPIGNERVLDGTVAGLPISLFPQGETYLTIMNTQLFENALAIGAEVRVRQENGPWFVGTIAHTPETLATYQPMRTILTTPDQFLALVPAAGALGITEQIAKGYADEFGKVRSRLPLDLALVYFHRKMPLYAAIDAARRCLDEPAHEVKPWKVQQKDCTSVPDPSDPTKTITASVQLILTDKKRISIPWDINTSFGDKSEDHFYPYVALASGAAQPSQMTYNTPSGATYVHVKDLSVGQEIAVAPSHFSYLWLDNSTRRYGIGAKDEDAPFSTQQVPLEEIEQLTKMWHDIKAAKITDTTLHGVIQLLLKKRMAWKDDEATFAQFAKDVLIHQDLTKAGITKDDVTNGRLFRCFDLHHRIMKVKLAD